MKIRWEDHCWPCRSVWRPLWVRCSRGGPCCVRLGTGTPGRPSLASRGPGFKGPWITPGLALGAYPGKSFEIGLRCCKTWPSLACRKHALATLWLWVLQKFPNLSSWRHAPSPNALEVLLHTGLLEACYGNIMALSLPKVCQFPSSCNG